METSPKAIVAEPKGRAGIGGSYILIFVVATRNSPKLATYREKRKAGSTPEPFGGRTAAASRFVVQLHAARARHYDFRLEHDGVLLSWAVPKGPSPDPADKRLAVRVEDHPVDYIHFEGRIPEGNYGAGSVIVWDRGRFEAVKDFDEGLEAGKLLFDLYGYKLRGRWTLVKTKRSEKDWLLIKERDGYVREGDAAAMPEDSVLSGLTVEQVGSGEEPGAAIAEACRSLGAKHGSVAFGDVKPMLATPGSSRSSTTAIDCSPARSTGRSGCFRATATISPRSFRRSRKYYRRCHSITSCSTAKWWCTTHRVCRASPVCSSAVD
jgi:DNA ligase D-like protein (predicted 3'-phosphoesterase)